MSMLDWVMSPGPSSAEERLNLLRIKKAEEEENLLRRQQDYAHEAIAPAAAPYYPEFIVEDQQKKALNLADPEAAMGRLKEKFYPTPDEIILGKPGEVPLSKRTGRPMGAAIPGGGSAFKPTNMQIPGTDTIALARTQEDYDALAEAGYVESGTSVPGAPAPADKKSTPNDYMEDPANPNARIMVPGGSAAVARAEQLARPALDERKLYNEAATQYASMADLANDDSGASDISLVYGFFKANDPISSVREGEFAVAGERLGLPTKIIGELKSLSSGRGFLTRQARQALLDAAGRSIKQRKKGLQRTFRDAASGIDSLGVDRKAFLPFSVSDVNLAEVRKEFPDAQEDTAGRVFVMKNGKRAYVELDE